ncbi:MAG: DUF948 domain-containing protein [Thermodesulfovibrionales bacterium]
MDNIWLIIIAVSLGAVAAFLVPLLLELRRTVLALRETVETRLNPTLEELQKNLRTMNSITENVDAVTTNVRQFSQAVNDVGHTISAVNAMVNFAGSSAAVRLISLRTGISAAVGYLVTNLVRKGDRR